MNKIPKSYNSFTTSKPDKVVTLLSNLKLEPSITTITNEPIFIPPPNTIIPEIKLDYQQQKTYVMTLYFNLDKQINLEELYKTLPIFNLDLLAYNKKKYDISDMKDITDGAIISIRWNTHTKGFSKLKFMTKKILGFKEQIIFAMSVGGKLVSVKFWADGLIHITGGTSYEFIDYVYSYLCKYLCHHYEIIDKHIIFSPHRYREYPNIVPNSRKCSMDNKRFFLGHVINKLEFRNAFIPIMKNPLFDSNIPECVDNVRVYLAPKKAGIIVVFNLKSSKKQRITYTFWNKVAICSGISDRKKCSEVFNFLIYFINLHRQRIFAPYDFDNEWRNDVCSDAHGL
jgi:hypothetical protein